MLIDLLPLTPAYLQVHPDPERKRPKRTAAFSGPKSDGSEVVEFKRTPDSVSILISRLLSWVRPCLPDTNCTGTDVIKTDICPVQS